MTTNPLVSVIIPAYNAERYIEEAVESARVQTYTNTEIIVIDDGSTDGTKTVLEPYIHFGKIRYFHQENKGLAAARNAGIRGAHGEFIAFLDADDMFLPIKIEAQTEALAANPTYDVCYSDLLHFMDAPASSKPRRFYHHVYRYPSGDIFGELLKRQFLNPLTVIARRELFEKHGMFDESLRRSEDWDLWLRWAHAGVKFLYLNKPLAYYRVRAEGNLSALQSEPEMKAKNLFVFSRLGEKLSLAEREKYNFPRILSHLRLKLVFAHLMVGDKKTALANAGPLSGIWRLVVHILPARVWRIILTSTRTFKHRLLLRKL